MREGGREVQELEGKTTIGRLKYLLVWNSACTRSGVFLLLLHDDWGYKTQRAKNVATNKSCARGATFPQKNQPKFSDPPPVSSRPCGRKQETRKTTTMATTSGWTCSTIHPSIHMVPPQRPFFSSSLEERLFLLIHSSFIISSSIQNWVSHPFPDSVLLLIHLGGLPFSQTLPHPSQVILFLSSILEDWLFSSILA